MLALLGSACGTTSPVLDTLIINANVIDVEAGTVTPNQYIGIRGDSIVFVGDSNRDPKLGVSFDFAQDIDAAGAYAMPGLWDGHIHLRGGDSLQAENKALLPLFLAHGITSVRDAGGDLTAAVLRWRDEAATGQLASPYIYTSGPKIDGPKPRWGGSLEVESAQEIAAGIDSLEQLGVEYVKIYDSTLDEKVFYEIVRKAEARGLPVTGHMPMDADLLKAATLGLDGVEHLYYFLAASSSAGDSIRALGLGYRSIPLLLDSYNEELAQKAFSELAARDFYATPTLHIGHVLEALHTETHENDELLALIGPGIQRSYAGRTRGARSRSLSAQANEARLRAHFDAMVLPLHEAGVHLIAGSDCGAFNSYVYPSQSLHAELAALVTAGLTPREALLASIQAPARFLNVSAAYGSLHAGAVADIILLTQNPLDDISALGSLTHTIARGRVYDRESLDSFMDPQK